VSALGALVGAAAGQGWKIASAVLASALLTVAGAGGAAWWLSDRALTKAEAEVAVQRGRADDYQAAIREQNRATEVLARETAAAQARGRAAQQQTAVAGKRYDAALQDMESARRITTCADAMPFVNKLLEDVR
jgi:hypothetical protein